MSKELANKLFPDVKETIEDMLKKYPKRKTTAFRIAPSPTGYMHIGTLGMAICDMMLARATGGINILRIEDTDQKREVTDATEKLINSFNQLGVIFDEGFDGKKDYGKYGPYVQSKRTNIYHVFAKYLVEKGKAYPEYNEDGTYAIRFKAPPETIIKWQDLAKGDMTLAGLKRDPIIIKSNGIPPYNFAHVVDDTLMGTTHVLRGEEWLPSAAEHIQIWHAIFGEDKSLPYQYTHMPVICIEEEGNKRKLSKRKDKEALVEYFLESGYPIDAIIEYLITIYNTDYEIWRTANADKSWKDFTFKFEKIGSNNPLFDWNKLNDISKNMIANWPQSKVEEEVYNFYKNKLTEEQLKKVYALLAVDRGTERPRKDIAKYSDILTEFDYIFKPTPNTPLLTRYSELVKKSTSKDHWLELVKQNANDFGYKNMREFTQAVRVELTGKERTTDLYTISKLLLN